MGAFLITAFVPIVLIQLQVPLPGTVAVSAACGLVLAWYSGVRVLSTLSRVHDSLPEALSSEVHAHRDELAALEHRFSHLVDQVEELEKTCSWSAEDAPVFDRTVWEAELSTGHVVTGTAVSMPHAETDVEHTHVTGDAARVRLKETLSQVEQSLKAVMTHVKDNPAVDASILEFQLLLLQDQSLLDEFESGLLRGATLGEAVDYAFHALRQQFEAMHNPYFRARGVDCEDLRSRVQRTLRGRLDEEAVAEAVAGKIVLCEQLMPSEVLLLSRCGALGVIAEIGTACSHTEILLSGLDMPSLSRFKRINLRALDGLEVLLDCGGRNLIAFPTAEEVAASRKAPDRPDLPVISEPVTLTDGTPVVVAATINNIGTEAATALSFGADAVGLFRSEMEFIARTDWPSEEDLTEQYRTLVSAFEGRPVVMRMLDLGGDKLPGAEAPREEENPCMGQRSMRLLLANLDLFRVQARAMLRAANDHTAIIYPMISGWYELEKIQKLMEKFRQELEQEGERIAKVRFGLMVEVPSVVERFDDYVEHFDVFNLGTNDLTQYTLAADRNNDAIADYYACHHPSLLSMIQRVCRTAERHHKEVIACGEMARETEALKLLIGLGVRRFSVPMRHISTVKATLQVLDKDQCVAFAQEALACRSAREVADLLGR